MKFLKKTALIGAVIAMSFLLIAPVDSYYFKVNKSFEVFGAVFRELSSNYVEELDPEQVLKFAIEGITKNLDPYTVYYDSENSDDLEYLTSGSYVGFGITVGYLDSMITVTSVRKGYPAHRYGMRVGDRIYSIDSNVVLHLPSSELRPYTKGEAGEKSEISLIRDGRADTITMIIPRGRIKSENVPVAKLIDNKIAYVKLEKFTRSSTSDVKTAINKLKNESEISSIILDLRGNPGGLLDAAVSVSEIFLPLGSQVVSTKTRRGNGASYKSVRPPMEADLPLAVLIDGNSASASEIVAGAIQDNDRGIIVGEKSFGKGLVQSVIELPYSGNLKITTARYFTPSGRSIQRLDYLSKFTDEEVENDSIFYTKNNRLVRELDGIMPDTVVKPFQSIGIVASLEKNRKFFNFANIHTSNMDSLPANFPDENKIFKEFKEFVLKSNFEYESEAVQLIRKASEIARKEKLPESIQTDFEKLAQNTSAAEKKLIENHKQEITENLIKEIRRRFMPEEDYLAWSVRIDPVIEVSAKLLESNEYGSILAGESASQRKN